MNIDYYEIAGTLETADVTIGSTGLKRVTLTEMQEQEIMAEIKRWNLIRDVKGYEELYWHNNDIVDHSSRDNIINYYGAGVIVKDCHFYGTIVRAVDTASMGLSVTKWEDAGFVCIDGFHDGKITEHESHGSDEVFWSHDCTYYLERKE